MTRVSRRDMLRGAAMLAGAGALGWQPWEAAAQAALKGKILYSRKEGDRTVLYVMNADGSGDKEVPGQAAQRNVYPAWSADGKRIGYTAGTGEESIRIILCAADGSNPLEVNTGSGKSGLPAWSPDGKNLAFAAGDERPSVHIADADGNGMRQINPAGTAAAFPFWTRDGGSLGYMRLHENEGQSAMVLAKADGSGEQVLLQADKFICAGANAVSPDGKLVAYSVIDRENKSGSLRTMELATKGENSVMELDISYGGGLFDLPMPCWTPDGKALVIPVLMEKTHGLYAVSLDGKEKKRLTAEGVSCYSAAWLPG